MKKHRVVIVGAGRIFKKHIDYIKSKHNKFFELVAIIEKKASKHKTLFHYNVPVLQFYKEVIDYGFFIKNGDWKKRQHK